MIDVGDYFVHTAPGFTGTTLWKVIEADIYDCKLELVHQIRRSLGELGQDMWTPGANVLREYPKAFLIGEKGPWEFLREEDLPLFYLGAL
jgi:hypothetical protein